MISALFVINQRGDIVISRLYRDDISVAAANAFRTKVIKAKEAGTEPPVKDIDGSSFLYTRHKNVFLVAVTRTNANPSLVFQFLFALIDIFKGYFGDDFEEESLRSNFTLVYELLDEVLDFGYPQNCALEVLQSYINLGTVQRPLDGSAAETSMTSYITGARDWRRDGIFYKQNKVFIDVMERVNLLLSSTNAVLRNDVTGQVKMKTQLTGIPDCKFGLNDKILMDRDSASGSKKKSSKGVEIDDCTFHRCVQLGKFEADRTITFVPPDGDFELMKYRIAESVNLPFRVVPVIEEQGKTRVIYNIKTIGNFSSKLAATNVVFKIPVPPTTARCHLTVPIGRAKYEPTERAIVWRIRRFGGGEEYSLRGEAELIMSTKEKAWVRPPISLDFQIPMFTASGLHVRSLKVLPQKESYTAEKWVRYITRAGVYEIRI